MRVPAKPISLDEALEMTRTGDVWLYRGRAVADRAIQISTNSPVNHVGMTVALDDLPPLMWHAELGRSLPDLWAGGHHRGVQLHDLRAAVIGVDHPVRPAGMATPARPPGHPAGRGGGSAHHRAAGRHPLPLHRAPGHAVAARTATGSAARARGHPGVGVLRRGGRRHLPGHGAAPDPPPAELVRPRPVLERRRPPPARRCPTRRRDRHPRPARTTAGTPPTTRTPAVTQQPPTSNPLHPAPSRQ